MKKVIKRDRLEVSSDPLQAELVEIKERIGALETIASISNRPVVEAYVRGYLTSPQRKQIMQECEEPRTREQLTQKFGFASAQALDHHLTPLRDADLIQIHFTDDGTTQAFQWSKLFKRLPKATIKTLLGVSP